MLREFYKSHPQLPSIIHHSFGVGADQHGATIFITDHRHFLQAVLIHVQRQLLLYQRTGGHPRRTTHSETAPLTIPTFRTFTMLSSRILQGDL